MASRRLVRILAAVNSRTVLGMSASTRRNITDRFTQAHVYSPKIQHAAAFSTSSNRLNQHIINIQDEDDFNTHVLQSKSPVIVDFHAQWCGPCKILGPRLETLVAEKAGKVIMAKVDIDDNSDLAIHHGVEAVPTVLAMKNGKAVDKFVGVIDETALEKFVNKLIGE